MDIYMFYCIVESNGQLLKDLKSLKLVLNHFESNSTITTTALKTPQVKYTYLSVETSQSIHAGVMGIG